MRVTKNAVFLFGALRYVVIQSCFELHGVELSFIHVDLELDRAAL